MTGNITLLIIVGVVMFAVLGGVTLIAHIYSLNGIKSRTVGDGQHGTARWANRSEIRKTYKHVPFTPEQWREQAKESKPPVTPDGQPLPQGIVVGCTGNTTAMVDTGDVHALMIGAAGVGKTAYWLYPCIEYACASGMSFLSTDTKGDIMRNYGQIANHTTQAAFRPGGRRFFLSGLRSDLTGFLRPFYATPPNRCDSNRPIVPLCAYSNLAVGAFAYHGGFHCRSPSVNRFDSLKND